MGFSVQNERTFVAIGDSQTAARLTITQTQTYPTLVGKRLNYGNVVNAGVGGNTTTEMLARFTADVLNHRPGGVSVMGFVNDMTTKISGGVWSDGAGISIATTKANVKSMVQQAQAARARVTLLSAVPVFATVYLNNAAQYVAAFLEVAAETGCDLVNVYNAFTALDETTRNSYLVDDQHPNILGHAFIANGIAPTVIGNPATRAFGYF